MSRDPVAAVFDRCLTAFQSDTNFAMSEKQLLISVVHGLEQVADVIAGDWDEADVALHVFVMIIEAQPDERIEKLAGGNGTEIYGKPLSK